ncbi:methyl-accepting chemotaxis protein [Sphingomonas sp. DT-51]|uniref:methyl-accepting chemotaxis protein n=1 Tax=Sphingomonas sp. DT-51 TaxID=3396165 RepID=UPI003F1DDF2C
MDQIVKNLSIGKKLLGGFGACLLLLGLIAALALYSQAQLAGSLNEIGRDRLPKVNMIADLDGLVSDYRAAQGAVAIAQAPADVAKAAAEVTNVHEAIEARHDALQKLLSHFDAIASLKTWKGKWDAFAADGDRMAALAAARQDAAAEQLYSGQNAREYEQLTTATAAVKDVQSKLVEARIVAGEKLAQDAKLTMFGCIAAAVVLVLASLAVLTRAIARPIGSVTEVLVALANGRSDVQVATDDRRDEVGALNQATVGLRNQLAAAERAKQEQTTLIVSSVGSGLDALARGDLTARIEAELTGPFAKLKDDFNNAMQSVAGTLTAVNASAEGITNGAGDIRQASDDLSRRTEQQAASLEETAAAMHEITTTVRETSANATRANAVVLEARQDAEQSADVVRRAVEAMNGIERSSNEISEIIAVIDGIAFQTNLLALNAGVEAARAGDAGKGFAVVASEVRALAQRSADAAKDVKSKITSSTEQVDAGVELVAQAGEALTRITGRIGEISTLVSDIASAAEQQATGLQQVNTAVSEMDGVTQQNAAMVEEATAAARSLAEETENMSRQVSRFRLSDRAAPASGARQEAASSPVHQLQARAAHAGARIAVGARANRTSAAVAQDDWSSF